jgi:hypothetical protein
MYHSPDTEVDDGLQASAQWSDRKATYSDLQQRLHHYIPKEALYASLRRGAMMYGPTFRAIDHVFAGRGETHGVITIPDTASTMPHGFEYAHTIHPATLDAIIQLTFGTMLHPADGGNPGTHVPVGIGKLYIAANLPSGVGAEYHGYATTRQSNAKETACTIVMSDSGWTEPKVVFENLTTVTVATAATGRMPGVLGRRKCARLVWVRDIRYSTLRASATHADGQRFQENSHDYRRTMQNSNIVSQLSHGRDEQVERDSKGLIHRGFDEKLLLKTTPNVFDPLPKYQDAVTSSGGGLTDTMTEAIGDLIAGVPHHDEECARLPMLDDWLKNARSYNPNLSILLLGNGTARSAAQYVAREHCTKESNGFRNCVFAEVETDLLQTSQDHFNDTDARLTYTTFDPAEGLAGGGIREQTFDVIVAPPEVALVELVLTNLSAMLTRQGLLILSGSHPSPEAAVFLRHSDAYAASLPAMADFLDCLRNNPGLWEGLLNTSNLEQRGDAEVNAKSLTMMAGARRPKGDLVASAFAGRRVVLILPDDPAQPEAAQFQVQLEERLSRRGAIVSSSRFADCQLAKDVIVISLAELSSNLIASMTESTFAVLKTLVGTTSALVWLTRGAVQYDTDVPRENGLEQSLATGLFRSIRSEFSQSVFVHPDISLSCDLSASETVDLVLNLIEDEVFPTLPHGVDKRAYHEREVVVDADGVLVPRLLWDDSFNRELAAPFRKPAVVQESLHWQGRALKLVVDNPGHLDSLRWVDDHSRPLEHELASDECLVKVQAWPLNFMVSTNIADKTRC